MEILNRIGRDAGGYALFLDMDGTLIDFAPTPDAVLVPPDLVPALQAAASHFGGALALLSGRSIAELDRLTAPLRLPASGLHGAEIREHAASPVRTMPHIGLPGWLRPSLTRLLRAYPLAWLEDKGVSLAVHYRRHPAIEAELERALRDCLLAAAASDIEMVAGDLVFELKPAGFDKGKALRTFMALALFSGRRPVFVSDHPVDQAGFDTAAALGGVGISVGRHLPGVACSLADPREVRSWLLDLAA